MVVLPLVVKLLDCGSFLAHSFSLLLDFAEKHLAKGTLFGHSAGNLDVPAMIIFEQHSVYYAF